MINIPSVFVRSRVLLVIDAFRRRYELCRRRAGYSWYAVREARFQGTYSVGVAGTLPPGDKHSCLPPSAKNRRSFYCYSELLARCLFAHELTSAEPSKSLGAILDGVKAATSASESRVMVKGRQGLTRLAGC